MLTEIPGYPVQAVLGLLLGFVLARYMRRGTMVWTWVVPLTVLGVTIITLPVKDPSILNQVLRYGCAEGGPCFDRQGVALLGFGVVSVASIAYSLGATLAKQKPERR